MTPLQHAAYKAHVPICRLLLAQGANVNSYEHEHGYTALMFAALSGKIYHRMRLFSLIYMQSVTLA